MASASDNRVVLAQEDMAQFPLLRNPNASAIGSIGGDGAVNAFTIVGQLFKLREATREHTVRVSAQENNMAQIRHDLNEVRSMTSELQKEQNAMGQAVIATQGTIQQLQEVGPRSEQFTDYVGQMVRAELDAKI